MYMCVCVLASFLQSHSHLLYNSLGMKLALCGGTQCVYMCVCACILPPVSFPSPVQQSGNETCTIWRNPVCVHVCMCLHPSSRCPAVHGGSLSWNGSRTQHTHRRCWRPSTQSFPAAKTSPPLSLKSGRPRPHLMLAYKSSKRLHKQPLFV